jgi:hypothetical protein
MFDCRLSMKFDLLLSMTKQSQSPSPTYSPKMSNRKTIVAKTFQEVRSSLLQAGASMDEVFWVLDIDEVTLTHKEDFATDGGADLLLRMGAFDQQGLDLLQARMFGTSNVTPVAVDTDLVQCARESLAHVAFVTSRPTCTMLRTLRQLEALFGRDSRDMLEERLIMCDGLSKPDALTLALRHGSGRPGLIDAFRGCRAMCFMDDRAGHVASFMRSKFAAALSYDYYHLAACSGLRLPGDPPRLERREVSDRVQAMRVVLCVTFTAMHERMQRIRTSTM